MVTDTHDSLDSKGLLIPQSADVLRNYASLLKALVRAHAGWFLCMPAYEAKYRLAYNLYDCSECVTRVLARLSEMRGGKPKASVRPELNEWLLELTDAPDSGSYGISMTKVVGPAVLATIEADLDRMDLSANANEVRLLGDLSRAFADLCRIQEGRACEGTSNEWADYIQDRFTRIGGLHGQKHSGGDKPVKRPPVPRFQRPRTIIFDDRISIGSLMGYQQRQQLDSRGATVEQFKVFFNEFYAAALLASIIFDSALDEHPWEFYADFCRHFWDEARHSEFGAIRLKELGVEPERINPVLFEEAEGLPVLHRIAYLTRGLEAYFMPRKPKRMKEYLENGDKRSQLFADQDWSDEINHVRYGSRWTDHLLEDDMRSVDDVLEEVREHLSKVRGQRVDNIEAPF